MHGDWEVVYLGAPADVRELEIRLERRGVETYVPERIQTGGDYYGRAKRLEKYGFPIFRLMVHKDRLEEAQAILDGPPDPPVLVSVEGNEHLFPCEDPSFEPVCPGCGGRSFVARKLPSIGRFSLGVFLVMVVLIAANILGASLAVLLVMYAAFMAAIWKIDYSSKHRCTACGKRVVLRDIRGDYQKTKRSLWDRPLGDRREGQARQTPAVSEERRR